MKYLSLVLCCIILCAAKPPQHLPKYGVQHCWFFSKQAYAGNIQVDENGKPITKGSWMSYFIYLETRGDKIPIWEKLVYESKKYDINILPIKDSIVSVGKELNTENDIVIKSAKGSRLWKLQISAFQKNIAGKIFSMTLNGKQEKQKIHLSIQQKIIQLEPEMRP